MTTARNAKHVSLLWATPEHAADLATCHATLFPEPWDAASFETMLADPGSTAFAARHGNPQATVGFIVGRLVGDEAEIQTLGVVRDWQRHGVGRRLIEAFSRAVGKAEGKRVFLEVADNNVPALVLYSRLGFKESGRRKGYYQRSGQPSADALVLALAL